MFDARYGLSAQALDELHRARHLVLALKDRQAAVLGYWLPDDERLHTLLLPARVQLTAGHNLEDEQPLVISQPEVDALWQHALRNLRPHERVVVEWSVGWGGVSLSLDPPPNVLLSIGPGGAEAGSLHLGRTTGTRVRRGQTVFRSYGQPG